MINDKLEQNIIKLCLLFKNNKLDEDEYIVENLLDDVDNEFTNLLSKNKLWHSYSNLTSEILSLMTSLLDINYPISFIRPAILPSDRKKLSSIIEDILYFYLDYMDAGNKYRIKMIGDFNELHIELASFIYFEFNKGKNDRQRD